MTAVWSTHSRKASHTEWLCKIFLITTKKYFSRLWEDRRATRYTVDEYASHPRRFLSDKKFETDVNIDGLAGLAGRVHFFLLVSSLHPTRHSFSLRFSLLLFEAV